MDIKLYELLEKIASTVKETGHKQLELLSGRYNTSIQNLVKTTNVSSNCPDILFLNATPATVLADGNVTIDNFILKPGDFIAINGNNGELNNYVYNVVFDINATKCVVIKRLYVK